VKTLTTFSAYRVAQRTLALLGSLLMVMTSVHAYAQTAPNQGNNAVYNASSPTGSYAYIDAYVLAQGDICETINYIMLNIVTHNAPGVVIDARGFAPQGVPPSISCNKNPFDMVTAAMPNTPVTVLLPATMLAIEKTWTIPNNSRIVGEGRGTIVANLTAAALGDMIDMGSSTLCPTSGCTGVVVEHLKLQSNEGDNGIVNSFSQEGSYVDDVAINLGATSDTQRPTITGLVIDGPTSSAPGAANSGPYSNIHFNASASCNSLTCIPTAAVKLEVQTRGLHGITCTANSNQSHSPLAAIYLDANSTSIEDVHIEGFYDGIVVGDNADGESVSVVGNTIANVTSSYGGSTSGPVINVIHICAGSVTNTACSSNTEPVGDLSIIQVKSVGGTSSNGLQVYTVRDDLTHTTLNLSNLPSSVGMYILGEQIGGSNTGQYSRFTTSPGPNLHPLGNSGGVPNWSIGGTGATLGDGITSCSSPGAIFSNTQGAANNNNTVYVCSGGKWWPIV
jgi:hypothetical protein